MTVSQMIAPTTIPNDDDNTNQKRRFDMGDPVEYYSGKSFTNQEESIEEMNDGLNNLMIACQQGLEHRIVRVLEKKVSDSAMNLSTYSKFRKNVQFGEVTQDTDCTKC